MNRRDREVLRFTHYTSDAASSVYISLYAFTLLSHHQFCTPFQDQLVVPAMSHADEKAEFEDLWDQMEKLAKSRDEAERNRSRNIAKDLVSYTDLPRPSRIRAHMALALLVCPRDALHKAKKNHATIHAKVSSELQIIREAYKNKETEESVVNERDEAVEETSASTLTRTPQLGPGSQEEPIDLTFEHGSQEEPIDLTFDHDSGYFENTSSLLRANCAGSHVEGTEVLSTGFSLWPTLLTALSAFLFIHQPTVHLVPTLMTCVIDISLKDDTTHYNIQS